MRQSKQQLTIKRKPLKGGQLNRQLKFSSKQIQLFPNPQNKSKIKQNQSIQNVSLIQGASFISNKQDGSMDSMDKMIIGVTAMGIDEKQFEEESQEDNQGKSKESKGSVDLDFTYIHKQYQKLIGRNQLLGEEDEVSQVAQAEVDQNSSRVLMDQQQWQLKQSLSLSKKLQNLSESLSPKKKQSYTQLKHRLIKIQAKIQQLKPKKSQDISNNSIKILASNLGNLSEIHQQKQKQNYLNTSVDTERKLNNNEEDEQQFIDFVRQPDPHLHNQNQNENEVYNQGENREKKHYFPDENIVHEWQVSPTMFQNLELEIYKQKQKKNEKSRNYQQILEALNSKQEQQTPSELMQIFNKRQNWIKMHENKSEAWKVKELGLLSKMKKVMKNPHYDSSDSDQ